MFLPANLPLCRADWELASPSAAQRSSKSVSDPPGPPQTNELLSTLGVYTIKRAQRLRWPGQFIYSRRGMSYTYPRNSVVLVTGANGHVAQHLVDQLLARPERPRVRGTVRAEAVAERISSFYADEVKEGRLEVVVVSDIVSPGAFDSVVQG